MEESRIQRGFASLRWFLAASSDVLPEELTATLQLGEKSDSNEEWCARIQSLDLAQLEELYSLIEKARRTYFGSFNGHELIAFIKEVHSQTSG